ncbi:hypothetical protein D9M72_485330 [compost metagenome]
MAAKGIYSPGCHHAKRWPGRSLHELKDGGVARAAAEIQHGHVCPRGHVGTRCVVPSGRHGFRKQQDVLLRYARFERSRRQPPLHVFVPRLRVGQDHLGRSVTAHEPHRLTHNKSDDRSDEVHRVEHAAAKDNGVLAQPSLRCRFERGGVNSRDLKRRIAGEDFAVVRGYAGWDRIRAGSETEDAHVPASTDHCGRCI